MTDSNWSRNNTRRFINQSPSSLPIAMPNNRSTTFDSDIEGEAKELFQNVRRKLTFLPDQPMKRGKNIIHGGCTIMFYVLIFNFMLWLESADTMPFVTNATDANATNATNTNATDANATNVGLSTFHDTNGSQVALSSTTGASGLFIKTNTSFDDKIIGNSTCDDCTNEASGLFGVTKTNTSVDDNSTNDLVSKYSGTIG